jgi:hypothetical protein
MSFDPSTLAQETAQAGFARIPDVLDRGTLELARSQCDALLAAPSQIRAPTSMTTDARNVAPGNPAGVWMVQDIGLLDPWLTIASDPRLLSLAAAMLGPAIDVHLVFLRIKSPGGGGHAVWHQDYPFERQAGTMSLLVALDATTADTGATWVIPRSHLHGPLRDATEVDIGRLAGQPMPVPTSAGEAIVLHDCTVHRAGPHSGESPRRNLIIVYRRAYRLPNGTGQPRLFAGLPLHRPRGLIRDHVGIRSHHDPRLCILDGLARVLAKPRNAPELAVALRSEHPREYMALGGRKGLYRALTTAVELGLVEVNLGQFSMNSSRRRRTSC